MTSDVTEQRNPDSHSQSCGRIFGSPTRLSSRSVTPQNPKSTYQIVPAAYPCPEPYLTPAYPDPALPY